MRKIGISDFSTKPTKKKAHSEYEIYKEKIKNRITQVEKDFIKQIEDKTKGLKK